MADTTRAGVGSSRTSFVRMEVRLRFAAVAGIVVSVVAIVLQSLDTGSGSEFASSVGGGALLLFASSGIGAFGGLLFGLPKSSALPATDREAAPLPSRWFTPNSNLQDISDWLTKIIVGVGLIELRAIPGALEDLADFVAPVFTSRNEAVAVSLAVFGITISFILVYLWASVCLRQLLEHSESEIREQLEESRRRKDRRYDEPDAADADLIYAGRGADAAPPSGALGARPSTAEARGLGAQPGGVELSNEVASARATLASGEVLSPNYLRSLARQLIRAEQYTDAVWAYEVAYLMDPSDPAPLNFAGAALSKYLSSYGRAIERFDAALAKDPDYASAHYNKACALARRGDADAALVSLARAIELDGPRYRQLAVADTEGPDGAFSGLRDDSRFRELVES